MLRKEIEMRNFQTVLVVLLAFSIGASCANLENSTASQNETESRVDEGPCAPNPCRNGGNCTIEGDTYKCICPEYFEGENCSGNRICEVFGEEICGKEKCHYDEERMDVDCICEDGKIFDTDSQTCRVDNCVPNPCRNGGHCIDVKNDYICSCPRFYTGKDCSKNVWCIWHGRSACGDATCHYDEISETASCTCDLNEKFDKESKTCKGPCKPNPCVYGTCVANGSRGFSCECYGSYAGRFCNETRKVKDPCTPNPCQRGGSCMAYGSRFICLCKVIYSGDTCEHGNITLIAVFSALLGFGAISLVFGGVFYWKRSQRLKKKSMPGVIYQASPAVMPLERQQTNIYPSVPLN